MNLKPKEEGNGGGAIVGIRKALLSKNLSTRTKGAKECGQGYKNHCSVPNQHTSSFNQVIGGLSELSKLMKKWDLRLILSLTDIDHYKENHN